MCMVSPDLPSRMSRNGRTFDSLSDLTFSEIHRRVAWGIVGLLAGTAIGSCNHQPLSHRGRHLSIPSCTIDLWISECHSWLSPFHLKKRFRIRKRGLQSLFDRACKVTSEVVFHRSVLANLSLVKNCQGDCRTAIAGLGACPNICSCSRMAAGFRWALAFSASAQPCARTIPLNLPRRCRSGARSSKDCGSSISVATRPTLSPDLATETCGFPART